MTVCRHSEQRYHESKIFSQFPRTEVGAFYQRYERRILTTLLLFHWRAFTIRSSYVLCHYPRKCLDHVMRLARRSISPRRRETSFPGGIAGKGTRSVLFAMGTLMNY